MEFPQEARFTNTNVTGNITITHNFKIVVAVGGRGNLSGQRRFEIVERVPTQVLICEFIVLKEPTQVAKSSGSVIVSLNGHHVILKQLNVVHITLRLVHVALTVTPRIRRATAGFIIC
jgi:hypothetical protein